MKKEIKYREATSLLKILFTETCFFQHTILALLMVLSFSNLAYSEESTFENNCIWDSHASNNIVRRNFIQKRFITGLTKPVESTGTFKLYQNDRIEWLTTAPFNSKIVVSKNGIVISNQDSDSNKNTLRENFDDIYFKELGAILVTLHSTSRDQKSYEKLQKQFSLECSVLDSGEKTIVANPIDFQIKRFIKKIEIFGKQEPQIIIITDSKGDVMEVTLE